MWLGYIFGNEVALFLWYRILFSNNSDTFSATSTCWFENIHVLVIIHFTVINPTFIIFWKYISDWTNFEFLAMFTSLLLNISPQVGFAT